MYLINEIIERLKEKLKLRTDKELYEIMGVSQGVFSNWKARNTIPFEEITTLCFSKNINMKYILTGEENENIKENINFKDKIIENLEKLNDKELKYFYFLIESELAKKDL